MYYSEDPVIEAKAIEVHASCANFIEEYRRAPECKSLCKASVTVARHTIDSWKAFHKWKAKHIAEQSQAC